jgi:hypothetical protein
VKALQLHQQGAFATDATPALLAASLEREFGEVSQSLVMSWEERWLVRVGNTFDYETGTFANEALFTMLSFRCCKAIRGRCCLRLRHCTFGETG